MARPVVLLVDDEPQVLAGLIRSLRRQPYDIFSAPSGEKAIEIFGERQIDLVVSDEKMSGMQGSEFLIWVAENYPHVPRIMLTGEPSSEVVSRAVNDAGVLKFFVKPCQDEELARAIMEGIQSGDDNSVTQLSAESSTPR